MKKFFFYAAIAALFLTACNNPNSASTNASSDSTKMGATGDRMSKAERNKQTALASIRGFADYNTDAVLKDADKDIVDYGDGSSKPIKGLDSVKANMNRMMPAFKTAFPDYKMNDLVAVADSNYVMVWGKYTGTWKGAFMGQKPTGKSFNVNDVDIFKFNDAGKIIEHRSIQSNETFNSQVGFKEPAH